MTMTIRADEANFVQFGSSCFTSGNTQNQGSIERTQSRGVPGERGGESTDGCTPIDAGGEVMSRRRPTQRLVDQAWQPTSGLSGRWIGLSLSAENRAFCKPAADPREQSRRRNQRSAQVGQRTTTYIVLACLLPPTLPEGWWRSAWLSAGDRECKGEKG